MSLPTGNGRISLVDLRDTVLASPTVSTPTMPASQNASITPASAIATASESQSLLELKAPFSAYAATCDHLTEALAPLQVWPTVPDRQEAFTFSVLDLYGRVAYRSLRLRRGQYSDPAFLNRVILAARRALTSQGLAFPTWTDTVERPHNCSAVSANDPSPPCQTCRLMPCKF